MLPAPLLHECTLGQLRVLTDDRLATACGVRLAFTMRMGGVSKPPFDELNLADHVGDDLASVAENRALVARALNCDPCAVIVPKQIHGTTMVAITSGASRDLERAWARANEGADGLLVTTVGVAALLCFADCVPVILVAPGGSFAVVHAGWRGVLAHIVSQAVYALAQKAEADTCALLSAYIGPCICGECFTVDTTLAKRFAQTFGASCIVKPGHIDLVEAVITDLVLAGLARNNIVDAACCTRCDQERFFSYRGSGGVCGRQGAFAFRQEL